MPKAGGMLKIDDNIRTLKYFEVLGEVPHLLPCEK